MDIRRECKTQSVLYTFSITNQSDISCRLGIDSGVSTTILSTTKNGTGITRLTLEVRLTNRQVIWLLISGKAKTELDGFAVPVYIDRLPCHSWSSIDRWWTRLVMYYIWWTEGIGCILDLAITCSEVTVPEWSDYWVDKWKSKPFSLHWQKFFRQLMTSDNIDRLRRDRKRRYVVVMMTTSNQSSENVFHMF